MLLAQKGFGQGLRPQCGYTAMFRGCGNLRDSGKATANAYTLQRDTSSVLRTGIGWVLMTLMKS